MSSNNGWDAPSQKSYMNVVKVDQNKPREQRRTVGHPERHAKANGADPRQARPAGAAKPKPRQGAKSVSVQQHGAWGPSNPQQRGAKKPAPSVKVVPNAVFEESKKKAGPKKGILKDASPTKIVQTGGGRGGAQQAERARREKAQQVKSSGMTVGARMSTFFGLSDPSGGMYGNELRPMRATAPKDDGNEGVDVPRIALKGAGAKGMKAAAGKKIRDSDLITDYEAGMKAYFDYIKREKTETKAKRRRSSAMTLISGTMAAGSMTQGKHTPDTLRQISEKTMIREELMSLPEFQPIFIRLISLIQFLVVAAMILFSLTEEEFGKFGLSNVGEECTVAAGNCPVTFSGDPQVGAVSVELFNPWLGPNTNFLIQFMAKYTPCMRVDTSIEKKLSFQRSNECGSRTELNGQPEFNERCVEVFQGYSCCVIMPGQGSETVFSGGVSESGILRANYSTLRYNGVSYGMMSLTECQSYQSIGALWMQDPTLTNNANVLCNPAGAITQVNVVLRPCCLGIQGTCELLTKSQCDFRAGKYHEGQQLCSDVSCLQETCSTKVSGAPAVKPHPDDNELLDPNQWPRFIAPLFIHSGAIHFIIMIIAQLYLGTPIERSIGHLRIMLIYFISGIGGYLMSGLFDPYVVSVGSNPAVFGLLGVVLVELIQTWKVVPSAGWKLFRIVLVIIAAIVIGSLPFIDNMAQTGGLIFGTLSACIFLPYISLGKWHARGRKIILCISVPVLLVGVLVVIIMFYVVQDTGWCVWCPYVNCWNWDPALPCDGAEE